MIDSKIGRLIKLIIDSKIIRLIILSVIFIVIIFKFVFITVISNPKIKLEVYTEHNARIIEAQEQETHYNDKSLQPDLREKCDKYRPAIEALYIVIFALCCTFFVISLLGVFIFYRQDKDNKLIEILPYGFVGMLISGGLWGIGVLEMNSADGACSAFFVHNILYLFLVGFVLIGVGVTIKDIRSDRNRNNTIGGNKR